MQVRFFHRFVTMATMLLVLAPAHGQQTPPSQAPAAAETPAPTPPANSDSALNQRVREALMKDTRLSQMTKSGLVVQTSNGVTTLRGNVSGPIEANRIIQTVRQVTGREAINGMTSLMRQNDATSSDIDLE